MSKLRWLLVAAITVMVVFTIVRHQNMEQDSWVDLSTISWHVVSLGSMTVNLAHCEDSRPVALIFETEVGINAMGCANESDEVYNHFTKNIQLARKEVLDIFSAKTHNEVRTYEGRWEASEIVKYRLREVFDTERIVLVVFPEFKFESVQTDD
ncbi:MAG: hypothetical protein FWB96_10130 [Defluviitaleaceae bacterium]|nr:hypothetical protein [Defluviitaleaceae bacterium]MCL2263230.1 hypothetical protein [Defluviitaleaceae bacterium]